MSAPSPIAIVGGGPAGALAAAQLAKEGRRVLLFDEKLAWEKPCGGGSPIKLCSAIRFWPRRGTKAAELNRIRLNKSSDYNLPALNLVDHCELISPAGKRARFRLQHPVAIFSRLALNGLLLERARRASADIHKERITRIERADNQTKTTGI